MRISAFTVIGGLLLASCAAGPAKDEDLSCAELARRQAAAQFARETALLDEQGAAQGGGGLQRDFIAGDAEALRQELYRDCLRRRGEATE